MILCHASGADWGNFDGAQYLAAVKLVKESTVTSKVHGARLTRYAATLTGQLGSLICCFGSALALCGHRPRCRGCHGILLGRHAEALAFAGLEERHQLALVQSAANRNMEVHNYQCASHLSSCQDADSVRICLPLRLPALLEINSLHVPSFNKGFMPVAQGLQ